MKKEFSGASLEWLELVVNCRGNIDFKHGYDIVSGKIANDNVGETVSYVMQGIMRKEDAVERLKFEKINNQIIKFILLSYEEPIPVGTDEGGVYEYVLEGIVYHEKE